MQNTANENKNVNATTANTQKDESFKNKAGDLLEKAGHKISEAGATKIGQKIHDLGDALEKNHQNPSHPHKV